MSEASNKVHTRQAAVVFPHDCEDCISLGPHTVPHTERARGSFYYDLYLCPAYRHLYARYGDNGGSRHAGSLDDLDSLTTPALIEARRRALAYLRVTRG